MFDLHSWQEFRDSDPAEQWSYSIIMGAWFLGMLFFTLRSYHRRMRRKLATNQIYTTAAEASVERKRSYVEMKLRLRIAKRWIELVSVGLLILLTLGMDWAVLASPAQPFTQALAQNWYLPLVTILSAMGFRIFYRDLKRLRRELKAMEQA